MGDMYPFDAVVGAFLVGIIITIIVIRLREALMSEPKRLDVSVGDIVLINVAHYAWYVTIVAITDKGIFCTKDDKPIFIKCGDILSYSITKRAQPIIEDGKEYVTDYTKQLK